MDEFYIDVELTRGMNRRITRFTKAVISIDPIVYLVMPKTFIITLIIICFFAENVSAQEINAAYVKALYKKYPTQKSDLCAGCKLWVNPYYKSVADTSAHRPLLTYYIYTQAHRLEQEALDLPRAGIYAGWRQGNQRQAAHSGFGSRRAATSDTFFYRFC